jgi:hypothetical protein
MELWNDRIMKEPLVRLFPNIPLFQYSSGDFHPIPPRMLGPVEGFIGGLDQVVNGLRFHIAGYSKANGQGKNFFFLQEIRLSDLPADLFGDEHPALQIGVRQQNQKFLPAPASRQVLASQVFPFDKPFYFTYILSE